MGSCASVDRDDTSVAVNKTASNMELKSQHSKTSCGKKNKDGMDNRSRNLTPLVSHKGASGSSDYDAHHADENDTICSISQHNMSPTTIPEKDAIPSFDNDIEEAWWKVLHDEVCPAATSGSHQHGGSKGHVDPRSATFLRSMFLKQKQGVVGLEELFDRCAAAVGEDEDGATSAKITSPTGGSTTSSFSAPGFMVVMEAFSIANEAHLMALFCSLLTEKPEAEWIITRHNWRSGWLRHGIFSVDGAKKFSQNIAATYASAPLSDPLVKSTVRFGFRFSKKEGRKVMLKDNAAAVWETLVGAKWKYSNQWIMFSTEQVQSDLSPKRNVITVDQWMQLIDFAITFTNKEHLLAYDASTSSRPAVIDDFCEWSKQKIASNDEDFGTW